MEGCWKLSVCVLVFLLTLLRYQTDAIYCFVCDYKDPGCNDEFNKEAMKSTPIYKKCAPEYTYCRKMSSELNDEDPIVVRQCAKFGEINGEEGTDCSRRTGTYKVKRKSCLCDTDGCNSAETTKISVAFPAVVALIMSVLFL